MRELRIKLSAGWANIILALSPITLLVYLSLGHQESHLEKIRAHGSISFVTAQSPTTYFKDHQGENGFEYMLAAAFAESIGVNLEVTTKPTFKEIIMWVKHRRADFAGFNLVENESLGRLLNFSEPYYHTPQRLIYRNGNAAPEDLNSLVGNLVIMQHSPLKKTFLTLEKNNPSLNLIQVSEATASGLIKMVHDGEVDYAVIDSLAYTVNRHIYHRVNLGIMLSDPLPMSWVFPRRGDDSLVTAANTFLKTFISSGKLKKLKRQMFSQSQHFSAVNSKILEEMVASRLPEYQPLFEKAASANGLSWELLAAIGYQESHWKPDARSPTGVRGIMMLTRNTAREMQVENRLDAAQSIDGGSRYFAKLKSRLPKEITEPDRTWLALAAYNIGYAHMEDSQSLAIRDKKNPNKWIDVREKLPLLRKPSVYRTLKFGYARGDEAVQYVENIRYYTNYLRLISISKNTSFPSNSRLPDSQ